MTLLPDTPELSTVRFLKSGGARPATDIYALAKVVLEMLTGERVAALLPNAVLNMPLRVRELLISGNFGFSEESIDSLGRALEFDPTKRPDQAGNFAAPIVRELLI